MGNEKQAEGIIAFVGGSASGKTTIAKDTAFFGNFKIVVSTTSRPKRENEKEGIDYFFISQDEFDKKAIAGDFLDPEYFTPIINGELQVHGYGIDKTKYNFTNDIYIVPTDIKRAKKLKQSFGEKVLIIYLTVPQEERLIRARSRSLDFTEEEWNRRLKSEDKDYADAIQEVDYVLPNKDKQLCLHLIKKIIKKTFPKKHTYSR